MLALDEELWLVVHELRLRGSIPADALADSHVAHLVELGAAQHATRGVRLTITGRDAHTSWARLEPGSEHEAAIRRSYESFLPLNRELIRICTDWQVRPGGVANDHTDSRYDWSIVDRLRALDERAGPIARRAAKVHVRFTNYRQRLRHALERVDDGDTDWVTSPRCDSYHTVWMQLHEDLLLALGVERSSEPGA